MKKMFFALIAAFALLMLSTTTFAATKYAILYPEGIYGSSDEWFNVGCSSSSEWECVDDLAGTTDYLYAVGTETGTEFGDYRIEEFIIENLPADAVSIDWAKLEVYSRDYYFVNRWKTTYGMDAKLGDSYVYGIGCVLSVDHTPQWYSCEIDELEQGDDPMRINYMAMRLWSGNGYHTSWGGMVYSAHVYVKYQT